MAFVAELANTAGSLDTSGIFIGDGNTQIQIARSGRRVPAGDGFFFGFTPFVLNNSGQVAFSSSVAQPDGIGSLGNAIFLGDGTGSTTEIVRTGDVTPDGESTFTFISTPTLNDRGQVAFFGRTQRSAFDGIRSAIFLFDNHESVLSEVIREGDPLLGSTVSNLDLLTANRLEPAGGERSGLNASGQIAFQFYLNDGRSGIAIAIATPALHGDFDNNGVVNLIDLDFYSGNINVEINGNPSLAGLDLNNDGTIDAQDLAAHYSQCVQTSNGRFGTFAGDANLDGTVDVLNDAFALVGNLGRNASSWSEGDFNCDRVVNVLGDAFVLVANLGRSD